MSVRQRSRRVVVVGAMAMATLATPVLMPAADAGTPAKPGLVGGKVMLVDNTSFAGVDAATDASGMTYIGWIASLKSDPTATRQVFLCALPAGSSSCKGGVQTVAGSSSSTAAGIKVLTTPGGLVTLVWVHQRLTPLGAGRDSLIAVATSQSGGPVSASADAADAPSNSALDDAEYGPGGAIWAVTGLGAGPASIEVREGLSGPPVTVALPYTAGPALLAFAGTTPVITTSEAGSVGHAIGETHGLAGGGFSPVVDIPGTAYYGGLMGLVSTTSGLRFLGTDNDITYRAVIAPWAGTKFAKWHLAKEEKGNCTTGSHDLNTDASGRLVDVSTWCGKISIADLPNQTTASLVSFNGGDVEGSVPQITTTPRGHGVVVWSVLSGAGNRLYFNRILLAGLDTSVSTSGVTVTGPVSCQPASTIAVSVKGGRKEAGRSRLPR